MTFTIEGVALAAAITKATKIVGKAPDNLILRRAKKPGMLLLQGYADGRYVVHQFKAGEANDEFVFGVPVERLIAVCARRAEMNFQLDGGTLSYKATTSAYRGSIDTVESKEIELPAMKRDDAAEMTDAIKSALFSFFGSVALAPQFVSKDMFYFIEVEKDGIVRGASSDNFHMAFYEHKPKDREKTKEENIVLPFDYVSVIAGAFDAKQPISVMTSRSHLHVFDQNSRISLPLVIAPTTGESMVNIKKYLQGYNEKKPSAVFDADVEAINMCMANMEGIRDKEQSSDLVFTLKGDRLHLRMESKHGKLSDALDVKNRGKETGTLRVEPGMLSDVLGKLSGICEFRFFGEFLMVSNKTKQMHHQYLMAGINRDTDSGDKKVKKNKED